MTVNKRIMSHKIATLLAACLFITTQSASVFAQRDAFSEGYADSDLQFFSPVDFDFDNQAVRKSSGWFFNYDKLSWAATGDRVSVGDPNVVVLSEIIVPDELSGQGGFTTTNLTETDLQYQITNGLTDVPPVADFAWGERYEFGYMDGNSGWTFSLLDGPEVNTSQTFGAPDRNFFGVQQQFGFGSIHVNFDVDPNLLLGLRDYWGGGVEVNGFFQPTATLGGPGNNNGAIPTGDGTADDLDGDSFEGPNFILFDINGDGTVDADEVVGITYDLDDLHLFNITFNQLSVRNTTETQGGEIMRSHRLGNSHKMQKNQNRELQLGYGVRFLRLRDQFALNGPSPILGVFGLETETENQLVGPQIRTQYLQRRGRWTWNFDGRCMLAYNITDSDLQGSYGLDDGTDGVFADNIGLAPGALNRPLALQPKTFAYGRRDNEFSPLVELRTQLNYQITSSLAARLGYTAIFVDNVSRAAAITRYSLPDPGLHQAGQQDIFINGVNFGFDVVY